MRRFLIALLTFVAVAGPAAADTHYLSYNAADRVTQALTRGVTFEIERGLLGGIAVRRLISTSHRGLADLRPGGPEGVRRALPAGSRETRVYAIDQEGSGQGHALTSALCPGSDEAWLVMGRVQFGRPLNVHAVGRWTDGSFRHCVALSYVWRGEWAAAPAGGSDEDSTPPAR